MKRERAAVPFILAAIACATPVAAQSWRTEAFARQVRGEDRLSVEVRFAAGTVRIAPGNAHDLYRAELRYDGSLFDADVRYAPEDRRLHLQVTPRRTASDLHWDDELPQRLDLSLSPAVPVGLELRFGAARAEIELGGLSLLSADIETGGSESQIAFSAPNAMRCRRLAVAVGAAEFALEGLGNARCDRIELHGGAGEITLDFGGSWEPGTETRVELGVGVAAVTLRLPTDIGIVVDLTRFLATFDRSEFVRRGDRLYSRNFDEASVKLFFDINAALGTIDIDWLAPEG